MYYVLFLTIRLKCGRCVQCGGTGARLLPVAVPGPRPGLVGGEHQAAHQVATAVVQSNNISSNPSAKSYVYRSQQPAYTQSNTTGLFGRFR